ncbi:MAG: tRNA pseudouridine(55) synthase TruB [bacterium]
MTRTDKATAISQGAHFDFERGEVLNINKPENCTSFDVVKRIRALVAVKKVGHAGTLDPFARGVLLICTGKATKRVSDLVDCDKEYLATIELGKVTDTLDRTGTIIRETVPPVFDRATILRVCNQFTGEIWQTPPMYSAIKIKGQRLYDLARRGMVVDRKPRKVTIHHIELLNFDSPRMELRVTCSKGTYIRALAYDIGEELGCGAHLNELVRTRIGPYKLENAFTLNRFERLLAH